MQFNYKRIVLLAALCAVVLTGCKDKGDEAKPAAPTVYTIGTQTVTALAAYDGVSVEQSNGKGEQGEETAVYYYAGILAPAADVAAYVTQMTGETAAFSVVDETFCPADAPDYSGETGKVTLAREGEEEGTLQRITLEWSEQTCQVTTSMVEGSIRQPQGLTRFEAIDYFGTLSPAALGLEGSSMKQYSYYALDGVVFVDGQPCIQFNVYSKDNPEQTNQLVDRFLMSGDGRRIYHVDQKNGSVEKLKA